MFPSLSLWPKSKSKSKESIWEEFSDGSNHKQGLEFLKRVLESSNLTELEFLHREAGLRISATSKNPLIPQPTQKRRQTHINELPDEILTDIFSRVKLPSTLASISRVCKRWSFVMKDNVLWKRICAQHTFTPLKKSTIVRKMNGKLSRCFQNSSAAALLSNLAHSSVTTNHSSSSISSKTKLYKTLKWKHVFRQNHLTHLNWRRGHVQSVTPVTPFANQRGNLCMQFDDRWVVSVALGQEGKVWDLNTGRCHMRLHGHDGIISAVKVFFGSQPLNSTHLFKFIFL
jgi:hypothetical protein